MSTAALDTDRLATIEEKLDLLLAEMEASRRQRREWEELKSDLSVIARDAFNTAITELDDVTPFLQTG
ncbi:MAG: hypothetical protein D6762_07595, partial [Candidatus Neomarinimicrobiota bacterium]